MMIFIANDTITKEGMTTDEIQEVLKKKTHHIIPVIASNDIPTLLPLVGPTTKEFGFVINSQSDKKNQVCIGEQYILTAKEPNVVSLTVWYLSRQMML